MHYDFGDVVLVLFPFTNQIGAKQRPAVVVSDRAYNNARPDLVIMPITSRLNFSLSFGYVVLNSWQSAHLLKPSAVKPVFATIEQTLVLKLLGKLGASDRSLVKEKISGVFGLRT